MDVTTGKHTRWPLVRLGDVCEIINGATPSTSNSEYWDGGHAWITPAEMGKLDSPFVSYTRRKITDAGLQNCSAKLVPEYSVILSSRAPIGYVVINEIPMAFNQGCKGLVPGFKMNFQYLYYFLFAKNELLNELGTGTTFKELSAGKLKEILLPLPPLAEQQRIVARLDAAFAAITEASAAAEANLRNARALFDGFLQSKYNSWVEQFPSVKLNYLAQHITDGDHMPPPKASSGIPFITIGNIDKNTRKVLFDDTFFVSLEYYQSLKSNRKPQLGDILYTVTGSYGIPVLITADNSFCFQRHIGLIRPKTNIDSKWMYFMLLSPQIISQAHDGATGTAQKTVSLSVLRNYDVPSLPYQVQLSEARLIEKVEFNTTQLTAIYERKLAALTELKQSLLAEVFGVGE